MTTDRDTLIYPSVLGSTKPGDPLSPQSAPAFVEFQTNNQDTVIRGYVYWHIPPADAENREPVLMIEIDDETDPGAAHPMDVTIRIRRNDGLIYEGNQETTTYIEEET